ncbi:ubiquinone/menaquinone biosynthesis methyltransferase [candidate division KSB1 bacterium]|nr:ubiquinone/menaquinone biosynthesis methyltransferase [candidate division KSB1 bacterium]
MKTIDVVLTGQSCALAELMNKTKNDRRYPSVIEVSTEEHRTIVREIFSRIGKRYDFLNRLLSFRRDIAWRRFAVEQIKPQPNRIWLDVATGTADVAIQVLHHHKNIRIFAVDFVDEMLQLGQSKVRRIPTKTPIAFGVIDAQNLALVDESVGTVSVAFGLRNMTDRGRAIREFYRVLIPGGDLVILEMALPATPWKRKIFSFYLKRILPAISNLFSPYNDAYRYLGDSISHFPPADDIFDLLRDAGFVDIVCHPLTFEVPWVFIARRPPKILAASSG